MSKKTRSSKKAHKARYEMYKSQNRAAKNRELKLKRHLKKFPDDEQAQEALKVQRGVRRDKPKSKVWSAPLKRYAQQLAFVGMNGHIAIEKKPKDDGRDSRNAKS